MIALDFITGVSLGFSFLPRHEDEDPYLYLVVDLFIVRLLFFKE